MRVGVIFGAIRNPHEPPVAGEGGGARKAQIGAALENEIARANLCDCPYRTERTVSGWRIDQLQAVPSPDLLLERRERDFGFDRVLWTPAAGQRRPIGLTDPCLAVEGAGVEVLIEIGAGEAEALHLVAHRDEDVVLRVTRGEVGWRVEDLRNDLAAAPKLFRRSEEHTSELQSLMRISYAVFCLKKK